MSTAVAIDYVSPLPPVRSGIADYSRDLIPALGSLCSLRVAELPGQPVSEPLASAWPMIPASRVGQEGRLPLYQMGNNVHHEPVVRVAMRHPGVITLHDVVLHHLLVEMTLGQERLEPYLERLAADHGWVGERAARARRWGELGQAAMFSLSTHRTLLRRQKGVLVHSSWAAERVTDEDSEVRVRQVPMAIPLPPPADRHAGRSFRQGLGLPAEIPLIGSFGFQTPIKRTDQVIRALALPGMEETHLLIAGEVSRALDLEATARQVGVAARVHCVGFLPFEDFQGAISACDLCVNLRYPTAGETSASLLRVLAAGRAAIVSDYAHSTELPDDVVVKIPLGAGEVSALAQRVGSLLADRRQLREMSRRARRFIARHHDPARAAAAVVAACAELGQAEPLGAAPPRLPPPTSLVWRELWGELQVRGSEPPWPEGDARTLKIRLTNHGPARWLATARGTGGVMLELQWRRDPWSPAVTASWIDLPRDLEPGEGRDLETRLRRPPAAAMLIIEPHLQDIAGFNALGGPTWVRFF